MLYTDGASEARNAAGAELGSEGLSESLRDSHNLTADAVAATVTERVLVHAGDIEALDDDVTIVVVSRDGVNAAPDFESTIRSRSSLVDF
jgi:serine phosphatase RsbU (regulator of sigma subunit)